MRMRIRVRGHVSWCDTIRTLQCGTMRYQFQCLPTQLNATESPNLSQTLHFIFLDFISDQYIPYCLRGICKMNDELSELFQKFLKVSDYGQVAGR